MGKEIEKGNSCEYNRLYDYKKDDKNYIFVRRRSMFEFLEYPKCSTCKKAKKYLEDNNIPFCDRHIIDRKPTKEELNKWIILSGKEIKNWFNTSGVKYKELKLKDKLPNMTDDEKIELLSTDGMLVKRPILVTTEKVYIGFKENEWKEIIINKENYQ